MRGLVNELLSSLTFDVSNAVERWRPASRAFITGQILDTNSMAFTTNYFQCYDLALADGLNTITLTDRFGGQHGHGRFWGNAGLFERHHAASPDNPLATGRSIHQWQPFHFAGASGR